MPIDENANPKQVQYVPLTKALMYICIGVAIGLLPTIIQHLRYPTVVYDANNVFHLARYDQDEGTTADPYECVRKFLSSAGTQVSAPKGSANGMKTPKSVTMGSNTVDIKAFNVSRGLIYAMAHNMLFENPGSNYHGYRVYYGQKTLSSGGTQDVGILHPLNSSYHEITSITDFQIVDIPSMVAGPCPDMCY